MQHLVIYQNLKAVDTNFDRRDPAVSFSECSIWKLRLFVTISNFCPQLLNILM